MSLCIPPFDKDVGPKVVSFYRPCDLKDRCSETLLRVPVPYVELQDGGDCDSITSGLASQNVWEWDFQATSRMDTVGGKIGVADLEIAARTMLIGPNSFSNTFDADEDYQGVEARHRY